MDRLSDTLSQQYSLVHLRKEAADFTRLADREKVRMIAQRYSRARKQQIKAFEKDYNKRLIQAAKQIAKIRGLDFQILAKSRKPQLIAQRKALKRAATRDVQRDHQRRLGVLSARETEEMQTLVDSVRQRERHSNRAQQSKIKLITDERTSPDRQILRPSL